METIVSYITCVGCACVMLLAVVVPLLWIGRRRWYRVERW